MFTKSSLRTAILLGLGASTSFLYSTQPLAQPSSSGGPQLEEVLVTASKRGAVSLQDISGSISAVTSESLEMTQAQGFEDYIKMVPGLTSVTSGPGQTQIVIRGVNANRIIHQAAQTRSLAGLYVDEMPISVAGFNPDLGVIDVERVEVLRGPQGTLYGGSSMAGTIRIITRKPELDEFSGKFNANYSDTKDGEDSYKINGGVNVPLTDTVAMRFSAYDSSDGGYIDNVASGFEEDDYNSVDTRGGRAQFAFYGDSLDLVASFMYNDLTADGAPDEYEVNPDDPQVADVTDELQTVKVVQDTFDQEFKAFNLTLEYDFGPVTLTAAGSILDMEIDKHLDDTFRVLAVTPIDAPFSDYQAEDTFESDILELRLASNSDSNLEWVVGTYYESSERSFVQTQPTPNTNAFFVSIGGPPPCPTLTSTCFGAVTDSVFDGDEEIETTQYAVFGESTYHFTDQFRLKLGFRYFDYENDVYIFGAGPANGGVSEDSGVLEEDGWVPKVEVSYDLSDDHMLYATYSEGFRLGGVNGFVPAECREELQALGSSPGAPFESDSLENFEIGAKTSWLDQRLTANLAVYVNEFDDIQSSVALDCGFTQEVNAGKIENSGFEAEINYLASDAVSLFLGVAYVDSEVKDPIPSINQKGDVPPYIPEFTASGTAEYRLPIAEGTGYLRGDVRYVDSSYNEFSSVPTAQELPSYTIVDLVLGYEISNYNFSLFGKNVLDEEIVSNIDPDRVQPNQFTRGRPRTIGVAFTLNF